MTEWSSSRNNPLDGFLTFKLLAAIDSSWCGGSQPRVCKVCSHIHREWGCGWEVVPSRCGTRDWLEASAWLACLIKPGSHLLLAWLKRAGHYCFKECFSISSFQSWEFFPGLCKLLVCVYIGRGWNGRERWEGRITLRNVSAPKWPTPVHGVRVALSLGSLEFNPCRGRLWASKACSNDRRSSPKGACAHNVLVYNF